MIKPFWLLGLFLGLLAPIASADLGFWSAKLVGKWRHPQNGDFYEFRSNATYTFRAGAAKRRAGNISHSGFWKIVPPTLREAGGGMEGPVALLLKSNGQTRRLVADTVRSSDGEMVRNRYLIGGARWKRVR